MAFQPPYDYNISLGSVEHFDSNGVVCAGSSSAESGRRQAKDAKCEKLSMDNYLC